MYDSKTLADIQMRIAKGWVIRRDEMAMLLKMAQELVSVREGGKPADPATQQLQQLWKGIFQP